MQNRYGMCARSWGAVRGQGQRMRLRDGSCLRLKPRDASCSRREWLENHKEHLEARLAQINQELSAE